MGIKGINNLIKRHSENAFFDLPITAFQNKRIAVDAYNWMYTNMATARKRVINKLDVSIEELDPLVIQREWFLLAINFITGWLNYNITPIFVFDGKLQQEKDDTKAKRRKVRTDAKDKIDKLYELIRGEPELRPPNIAEDLKQALRNYNNITSEEFELFRSVIKGIGLPCFQASGDGEQLCSSLCVDGKVAAVFSVDTDNLVYACPLMIKGFSKNVSYDEYGKKVQNLSCVRHDLVLKGMNITHDLFVDLCIMSGCDFNTNIPGYAAIKSFNLLQKHGSIDNLPLKLN